MALLEWKVPVERFMGAANCYLNPKTIGAVGRLQPDTGGGGLINWPAEGLYWGAEPGPGGVLGATAIPNKGGQAEGAGGQG